MIEDQATVTLWCDSQRERCRVSATFKAPTRFDAVNCARSAGWYIQSRSFCLCPVHDNTRTLELIEHERKLSETITAKSADPLLVP